MLELNRAFYALGTVIVVGLFCVAVPQPGVAASASESFSLEKLQKCALDNMPNRTARQDVLLKAVGPAGDSRSISGDLLASKLGKDEHAVSMRIEEPPDLTGTRYLLIVEGQRENLFVYLPALRRTRRVTGELRADSLLGSDFSHEDIRQLHHGLVQANVRYLESLQRGGLRLHRLEVLPGATENSAYERIEIEVDDRTCLAVRTRYFDAQGLFKVLSSDPAEFRQTDDGWQAGKLRMENIRKGSHSILELSEMQFDKRIPPSKFNPNSFHFGD